MSNLIRRIQRAAPGVEVVHLKTGGTIKRRREGRNQSGTGIGSKLGVKNPKAKDLLARQRRDKKWGR